MSNFVDFFHRVDRWFGGAPVSLLLLSAFLTGMLLILVIAAVIKTLALLSGF